METDPVEASFRKALAYSREGIQADRDRVSEELKPVLSYIKERLFRKDLDVGRLERDCKLTKRLRRQFRGELGLRPKEYLAKWKGETAAWLLVHTDLEIWQVAKRLGYSRYGNFTRDFKKWSGGETPDRFRRARTAARETAPAPISVQEWMQAVTGVLPAERVAVLEEQILRGSGSPVDHRPALRGGEYGESQAEMVWKALRPAPHPVRLRLVREEICFGSPALFHLLGEKSRVEGREDRRRGIEFAELALASLEGSADTLGEAYHDLCALGWAWIGRARRLALDRDGADEAFARAGEVWQTPRASPDRRIEAEILFLKGTLRLFQRRFEEAQELLDRSIGICRTEDEKLLLAKSLTQRAKIADYLGDHEAAIADLQVALKLLEGCDEKYVVLVAYGCLATSYAWAGKPEKALEFLPEARRLCAELDNRLIHHQLQWIEGLARQAQGDEAGAEGRFRQARAGFVAQGELDHAGVTSLEIAILCRRQGRDAEVVSLAAEAIPVFRTLQTYPEAVTALRLLGDAVAKGEVTLGVLEQARDSLLAITRDPGSGFKNKR